MIVKKCENLVKIEQVLLFIKKPFEINYKIIIIYKSNQQKNKWRKKEKKKKEFNKWKKNKNNQSNKNFQNNKKEIRQVSQFYN